LFRHSISQRSFLPSPFGVKVLGISRLDGGKKSRMTGALVTAGAHMLPVVTIQVTWSPFFNVALVSWLLPLPVFCPLTCY
jgi:hypothetical protein